MHTSYARRFVGTGLPLVAEDSNDKALKATAARTTKEETKETEPVPTREIIHASAPKEDFVDPRVWGAGAWGFIHSFAWAAPHEMARDDVQEYERTLRHVGANLPCSSCRDVLLRR